MSAAPCWPRVSMCSHSPEQALPLPAPAGESWPSFSTQRLHFPGWEVHSSLSQVLVVPLSPACLASLGQHCVGKWQDTLAGSCDNSALCSLSCLHSLLHLPPCGILGAVCGCLAPPAVEGEYCPLDRELLQSQWFRHLSKEEEMGTCEGTRFAPAHLHPSSQAAM